VRNIALTGSNGIDSIFSVDLLLNVEKAISVLLSQFSSSAKGVEKQFFRVLRPEEAKRNVLSSPSVTTFEEIERILV
jgi:hypothetical protein